MTVLEMGEKAKIASFELSKLSTDEKNNILKNCASALIENLSVILNANKIDLDNAIEKGISGALIDRLTLNQQRVESMADGLIDVAKLDDPVGEVTNMIKRPNGLMIGKKSVPMGVVGIIFEARPNVTADAYGLCLKSGNATILRGGKEAINSNIAVVKIFRKVLSDMGYNEDFVQMVEDTNRGSARQMMTLNGYIDVLIPRGGAGLIQTVVKESTVPVIETGVGNCHVFVDESGDFNKAIEIILNAKTQRPGVCNACESLLIHKNIANDFVPLISAALIDNGVEIFGDEISKNLVDDINMASEEDWGKEYLDYKISMKIVENIDEAISHIRKYGTKHSECIITENYSNSQKFLDEIDAAAVYVNASTRFTDGSQFGFGAEIGISTQKLHARGPMGLKELTTTKYIIYGNGQIRK